MQITSYLEEAVTSELSGNVVDLCPVGALDFSKPYAFEARPWELKKTLTIDVMDAVGTNIRLDSRGRQVLRCVPRVNEDVNEEWATDKTRHAVDGLVRRRLDKPYVRVNGKLIAATWDEAFAAIAAVECGDSVAAVAGDLVDCETMYAAKALVKSLGSDLLEGRQTGMDYDTSSTRGGQFQYDDRGGRDRGCDPAGRDKFALGSVAGEHAHPQGDQKGGKGLRDRAEDRADLQGGMDWR